MLSREIGIRAAAAVIIATLLTWLVLDHGGRASERCRAVNDALKRGAIRPVATDEMAPFVTTVRWLAAAAGVREPTVVNVPFAEHIDNRLHVFTTTPAAVSITRCGRGNAIYDAELDAIFVDHDVIHSMDWDRMLAQTELGFRDVPSLRVYTRFVLLHEFGHRALHRRTGGLFDVGGPATRNDPQRHEREADHFATVTMPAAYAIAARFSVQPIEEYTGDTIQYRVTPSMPLEDQVQASLVEMANVVALGTEILSNGRSAFLGTMTHPSMLQRARGLIVAASTRPSHDPKLRALVAYTRMRLESAQLAGTRLVDVAADRPIRSVVVQADRLLLAVTTAPQLWAFPLPLLRSRFPGTVTTRDGHLVLLRTAVRARLTASAAGRFISIHDDHIEVVAPSSSGESRVLPLHLAPTDRPKALYASDDGNWILLEAEADATTTFYVIDAISFAIKERVSRAELAARCSHASGVRVQVDDLAMAVFTQTALLVPLRTAGAPQVEEHFVGVAELTLPGLAVRTVRRFQFPPEIGTRTDGPSSLMPTERGQRALTVVASGATARVVLVSVVRKMVRPDEPWLPTRFEVWELSEHAPARLVATRSLAITTLLPAFTAKELSTDLAIAPTLASVVPVAPSAVLVNLANDAVYAVDLNSGAVRVVFHPGGGSISAVAGGPSVAVITGPQSYDPWMRAFALFLRPVFKGEAKEF